MQRLKSSHTCKPSQTWAQENQGRVNWRLSAHLVQCADWDRFWMEREYNAVGGRLQNSSSDYQSKHQLLLPSKHQVTKLLIMDVHESVSHLGQEYVLNSLRQKYLIFKRLAALWRILSNSLICQKQNAAKDQSLWRRANARNVSFFTLFGGQFTFSTQLLTLNYLLIDFRFTWRQAYSR